MRRPPFAILVVTLLSLTPQAVAAEPNETITQSEQVLTELLAIPGKQIPAALLSEAQGVAIIPRVIKIGFVAGGRRGYGVVLVRDAEGGWTLPRFIRLTGGSVGWQAGVSGTDVVLVFRTRRSVENLMKGKFTIGVDAAAAAGPVGRNAAAATDTSLQAEILSYSRSRGLFLGASIDGSAVEMDNDANTAFYGSADPETPQVIPVSATNLQSYIIGLAGGAPMVAPGAAITGVPATGTAALAAIEPAAFAVPADAALRAEAIRRSLVAQSASLGVLLDPQWQTYLSLPPETGDPTARPIANNLAEAIARYEKVAATPAYASLTARPEFQATLELLRDYNTAVAAASSTLQLPAPPALDAPRR
jgi:lipid-binding SYLF domain-containing protein